MSLSVRRWVGWSKIQELVVYRPWMKEALGQSGGQQRSGKKGKNLRKTNVSLGESKLTEGEKAFRTKTKNRDGGEPELGVLQK